MKRILLVVCCLSILLTGCAKVVEKVEEKEEKDTSMFVEAETAGVWKIVYHKESKVMYAVSRGNYSSGIFTLLVNPDGTPMIYEGE